jgi:TonB-linked SusC/RagA family outer membrane protein
MNRRLITVSLLSACALFLPDSRLQAQGETGRISGKVTGAESALPLQGVLISVIGTQHSATTNPQGRYTIVVPPGLYRVRSSAVGYTPTIVDSVPVTTALVTQVDFALKHSLVQLEQIVVTGYGSLAKRDVTGAIGSVTANEIKQEPVTNAIDAIKGRIPGVDIVSTGTKPGDGIRVRVRGTRSLKASNDPLYVLDGIPMAGGIGDLNPSDIESIEVLKDASATAIYGSRGANGVVLVTSTKGKAGNTRTTYDTYVGAQTVLRSVRVFNGPEYADYKRETYKNGNTGTALYKCGGVLSQTNCADGDLITFTDPNEFAALKNGTFTDWQDLITRQGTQVSHQVSITGGNDRNQFAVSGNLLKQIGTTIAQAYDRKSMRVNYEGQATSRFRAGGSALLVRSLQNLSRGDGLYSEALADSPLSVPYDSLGKIVFKPTVDPQRDNPLSDANNWSNDNLRTRVFGTLFATLNLAEGLDYRANFGPDLTFNRNGQFVGAQTQQQQGAGTVQSMRDQKTFDYTLDNILTYRKNIGSAHKVDATLLYSVEKQSFEENYGASNNLPYESAGYYNLGAGGVIAGLSSQISEWALQSYMARLNYTLLDKYLLTLTSRIDGSSRLAEGNKFASFPSVALGWRVIDDAGQKWGPFNSLKLRGSFGTTGNTSVDPYQTQGSLNRTAYAFSNSGAFGYQPGSLSNPELRWEKTAAFDVGSDFGIFDGRLSGTLDYYRANTTDLLLDRALPPSTGYSSITQNVGATRNTGVELALSSITVDGWHGIHWTNDITFAHNKNEIVSLNGGKVDDPGNNWFIGQPINNPRTDGANATDNKVWRDYKFVGIWQTADSALARSFGRKPGEIRIADTNGDGKFSTDDKVILGNTYPVWTGALSSRVDFRGIDLSVQVITRQNFMLRNDLIRGATLAGRYNSIYEDYWTPTNPSNTAPRPDKNTESPYFADARGYQDGSFVKIRNITLGGQIPSRYVSRIGASSMRLYVTAQDPFLFTNATVLDPESQTGNGVPSFRTFLLGGSFGF